ncbi:hypothetical protein ILYODFUR_038941 [Ilyodon furcidens]|uniref:Uncharacterized protein n=1 Tax=Ilyodon furcidens TaxID=33524 RepID=A0ABV0T3V8_9TELE
MTTSSAKIRDEIHWPPNQTPSSPWLHLEIPSLKVMNRTGDKAQPCWSPTCTKNRSDFVPAIRTKLLLHFCMSPRVPCRGYRGGPVFHDLEENHTAPSEAEVRLSVGLSTNLA